MTGRGSLASQRRAESMFRTTTPDPLSCKAPGSFPNTKAQMSAPSFRLLQARFRGLRHPSIRFALPSEFSTNILKHRRIFFTTQTQISSFSHSLGGIWTPGAVFPQTTGLSFSSLEVRIPGPHRPPASRPAWPLPACEFANPASCKVPGLKTNHGELKMNFCSMEGRMPLSHQTQML